MLFKRNLALFFRDRANVFFSLLAVFIIIGLYALFLGETLKGLGFTVEVREDAWVLFCNNEENIESSPHITNALVNANYMEAGSLLEFKYSS